MLGASIQRKVEQSRFGIDRFDHKAAAAGVGPDKIAAADQNRLATRGRYRPNLSTRGKVQCFSVWGGSDRRNLSLARCNPVDDPSRGGFGHADMARHRLEALRQGCAFRRRVHGLPPADARERLRLHAADLDCQGRPNRGSEQRRRAAGESALSAAGLGRHHDVRRPESPNNGDFVRQ